MLLFIWYAPNTSGCFGYCAQNRLAEDKPNVRKRLLFYSLLLTSSQRVVDLVDSTEDQFKKFSTP